MSGVLACTVNSGTDASGHVLDGGKAVVTYDKMAIQEEAKSNGVSYAEQLAYVFGHEIGHVIHGNDYNDLGQPEDTSSMTLPIYVWTRHIYKDVMGSNGVPWLKKVLGMPPPSSPSCANGVKLQFPDFFTSLSSARSATYQYPTYDVVFKY